MNAPRHAPAPERLAVRILAVGDLDGGTDFGLFLRVFEGVCRWQPEAHLAIVGEGRERDALEDHVAQRDLYGQVAFPGALAPPLLAELLQRAHICVVLDVLGATAIPPALPIAMAGGVCVIGMLGGVAARLIEDGQNGLLVAPEDFEGLSRTLHLAIGNGDLRRQLGESAALSLDQRALRRTSA